MRKRILSMVLTMGMLLGLFPAIAPTAQAAELSANNATTFTTAISNAQNGDTVKLTANIEIGETQAQITTNKSIILDLNGNTLSKSGGGYYDAIFRLGNGASVTVRDSSGIGTMSTTTGRVFLNQGNGAINIEGGMVTTTCSGTDAVISNYGWGPVNISGGTVNGVGTGAIYNANRGKITISGTAKVTSTGGITIYIPSTGTSTDPVIEITGGTLSNTKAGGEAIEIIQSGAIVVSGGNVSGATGIYALASQVIVSGGSINNMEMVSGATIKNTTGTNLEKYTLTIQGRPSTLVSALSLPNSYAYGMNNVLTNASSEIYVWLPANQTGLVTANVGGTTYYGLINANAATLTTTVIKPEITATLSAPASLTYNGSPKAYTANITGGALTLGTHYNIRYTGDGYNSTTAPTNVGSYTATFELTAAGQASYSITTPPSISFTIVKATPVTGDLTYNFSTPVTYNGAPQGVSVTSSKTGIGTITVKYNGSTTVPTSAGSYPIKVDISAGTNYNAVTDVSLGMYTINKATPTLTPPTIIAPFDYGKVLTDDMLTGGTAKNPVNSALTVPGSWKFTSQNQVPSVGTTSASVSFTPTDTVNYNSNTTTVQFTVAKAAQSTPVAPAGSGTPTSGSITVTSVVGQMYFCQLAGSDTPTSGIPGWTKATGTTLTFSSLSPNQSYDIYTYIPGDANYNESDVSEARTSKTAPTQVTITVTTDSDKLTRSYAGAAMDVTNLFSIETNAGTATYSVTPGTGTGTITPAGVLTVTKAGTFTVKVDTAAVGNYAAGSQSATLTINKGTGSGTVTIDNWTFGDTAKAPVPASNTNGITNVTYSYEGTGTTSYTASATPPTNAGSYKVTATFAATDLYKECTAETSFAITAQAVTKPAADPTVFVYTGSEQTYTSTSDSRYTISNNKRTNAGSQTVTVTLKDKDNYVWQGGGTDDVTFTFAIAAQTVAKPTADASVFTYTGSEQTYTIASNALYTVTNNNRTEAGNQEVTVALNDKSNYTWADGTTEDLTYTFAIAKAPITFVVSGNSYTYDGVSKTATVTQTADQTPSVTDKFSVSYQQSGSPFTPKDAGAYDVMVTLNDDNFMFAGQADTVRTGKVGTLTIGKKSITALWKNLHSVYDGKKKSADFALTGVESGDSSNVSAQISGGEQTNIGFHSVTADLIGSRAGNYTLTNPTGTLVIQKAPVTFTVSGDMVKHDGSPKTATVTATVNNDPFTIFTVTYQKDNKAVATPSNVGTYDIYASVTNDNYRHVDGTDGTARKIGVLNIFKDTAPATYTLSFAPGEGGSGSMTALPAAQVGTARILPLCTFTKGDAVFAGWHYNGKTYQPGQVLEQPAANSTLTALWSKNTYSISGVVDQNGNPAADAVVTLMLGSRQMAETVTDSTGKYSFANLAPGLYNLVISKNGVTQTVKVELIASNAEDQKIILPVGKTNSVVSVASGAPAIVVGNLEKTFDTVGTVFTAQDKTTVTNGGEVEIKFAAQVKAKDAANAEQMTIATKASGTTVELYLDMTLTKTVTPKGATATTTPIPVSDVLLESVISLPAALQGKQIYTVYRLHAGNVDTLTTTPNPNGEYIGVSSDKTTLTLYTKNFSTYAIAWSARSSGGGSVESGSPINLDTAGITGGSIKSDKSNAALGAKVTITVSPNAGYKLAKLAITDKDGKAITYQDHGDGTYSFSMPSGKVNVTPVFEKTDSSFLFVDVTEGHWARKAIEWAYGKQLFAGTTQNTFAPNAATTRGMIVTVLFRMEGSPEGLEKATFGDVAADSYCANAIGWGSKHGVIKGYTSEKYGPQDNITREQMAAILYRYAEFKKYDLNKTTALDKFTDGKQTAEYAEKAMGWAIANDLFSGKGDGILDPTGKATRAEVATMLMRFDAIFGK